MLILHPKPEKLSDPFGDWIGSEKTLDSIVAKDKTSLDLSDYNIIYYMCTPAANYEEGAYYLDGCFDFMRCKQSSIESNICEGLFYFINYHREKLQEDGLLSQCLEEIASVFQSYTSSFEMMRLTDVELDQYKIDPSYREVPKYWRSVEELIDYLIEYDLFAAVLDDSLKWLNQNDIHKSCWWIAIADHVKIWFVIYAAIDESNTRKQRLIDRLWKLQDYSSHVWKHIDFVREMGFRQYEQRVSLIW